MYTTTHTKRCLLSQILTFWTWILSQVVFNFDHYFCVNTLVKSYGEPYMKMKYRTAQAERHKISMYIKRQNFKLWYWKTVLHEKSNNFIFTWPVKYFIYVIRECIDKFHCRLKDHQFSDYGSTCKFEICKYSFD